MSLSLRDTSSFTVDGTIDIFNSAYKDLRFNVSISKRLLITEDMVANLFGISYQEYGTIDYWRVLLYANGLQCPINDISVGMIIDIPDMVSVQSFLSKSTKRFPTITI